MRTPARHGYKGVAVRGVPSLCILVVTIDSSPIAILSLSAFSVVRMLAGCIRSNHGFVGVLSIIMHGARQAGARARTVQVILGRYGPALSCFRRLPVVVASSLQAPTTSTAMGCRAGVVRV